jgi:hypothetical protein
MWRYTSHLYCIGVVGTDSPIYFGFSGNTSTQALLIGSTMPPEVNPPPLTPNEISKLNKKDLGQRLLSLQEKFTEQGEKYGTFEWSLQRAEC